MIFMGFQFIVMGNGISDPPKIQISPVAVGVWKTWNQAESGNGTRPNQTQTQTQTMTNW